MTAAAIQGFEVQASPEIVHHWGWFLAFGIGLLALGIAAVLPSVTATIVSMVFSDGCLFWHPALKSRRLSWSGTGQVSSSICSPRFCSVLRVC
jgi:hypothetical protein